MTTSPRIYDTTGNHELLDGVQLTWDTMTNVAVPPATQPSIVCGTGTPTFSAPKGTIYTNLTAGGANLRLYVNTNGTTGWGAVTSAQCLK